MTLRLLPIVDPSPRDLSRSHIIYQVPRIFFTLAQCSSLWCVIAIIQHAHCLEHLSSPLGYPVLLCRCWCRLNRATHSEEKHVVRAETLILRVLVNRKQRVADKLQVGSYLFRGRFLLPSSLP